MITINISPIAFSLGPLEIRWYGIMMVVAVVAIIAISILEARRLGVNEDHIYSMGTWAVISGILVSRIVHVIDKWDYYSKNPAQIFGFEGLAVYGAVIGVILAIVIYSLVQKVALWQLADIVSPGALVGMAIGRIGCILNGCCYGLHTDSFCSITYTNPASYAPLDVAVLPTQLFHIIWNLLAFALLWALRRRLKPQGSIFLAYLAIYAAGDLIIRFFREGDPYFLGMQQAQVIGIIMLLVTVPWLLIRMWQAKKQAKS
jgi:phosphatidylglycerol---prolipoprotein diacylglyceryl transferase